MGRTLLKFKNFIKSLRWGKYIRDLYQARNFTRKKALAFYDKKQALIHIKSKDEIIDDMLNEAKKYSFSFEEYFMYHFYDLSFAERREYVSDRERIGYCERMNKSRNMIIFDDKSLTYKYYKKYYKRDLVGVIYRNDYKDFAIFFNKHKKFIVKPFDGACGRGIKIFDFSKDDIKQIFKQLKHEYPNGFVAEELIIQSDELGKFHRESVNTIRIPTIRFDDRTEIIHPFFRIGRGKSIIDNAGGGGIACAIDVKSGEIIAAADESGMDYISHPDSGLQIIGFKIPYWNDAKKLAIELAEIIPDNRYTGWDFALTDNGWVLQEANDRGGFINFQLPIHKGFKAEIEKILSEMNL